jgi:hypothetical protein
MLFKNKYPARYKPLYCHRRVARATMCRVDGLDKDFVEKLHACQHVVLYFINRS